jgi:hypothetical protein
MTNYKKPFEPNRIRIDGYYGHQWKQYPDRMHSMWLYSDGNYFIGASHDISDTFFYQAKLIPQEECSWGSYVITNQYINFQMICSDKLE